MIQKSRIWIDLFGIFSFLVTFASTKKQAKVAQLVERNLAKVEVASSNLVFRSEC
jgi:hypothetical protein